MDDVYASYVRALARADVAAAVTVLDSALAQGSTGRDLIREVVARGQREVGERWMDGTWSIADEHAATAVAEQSMAVLAPPQRSGPARSRVLFACAEGEWHTFAARLAADLTRGSGLDVTLLGGSIPAAHLQQSLRVTRPAALALSVTMPCDLIGASRSILAAHEEGVPVVVGGAAWGDGRQARQRAHRLGADAHLDDPDDLARAVDDLSRAGTVRPVMPIPVEALLLDSPSAEVLQVASERQKAAHPWLSTADPFDLDVARPDLRLIARYTAAAVACDDATILRDLLSWLCRLVTRRGFPTTLVHDGCLFLADAVEPEAPSGARLLREEAVLAMLRHQRAEAGAGDGHGDRHPSGRLRDR